MTIRLEVDCDSNDSDGGYGGEPDSDVAETTIPSDGEYAGEPDGNGYEINIGAEAGTIGSAPGTGLISGTSVVGTNSTGLISGSSNDATSGLGCLILAVSNMATFCLEGNFSNGELHTAKLHPLRGTRVPSNSHRTPTGVNVGSDAHTWVMTSGAKVP
jgi:hypothetical protein